MAGISFVVYDPPDDGLPFLAVMFAPDGSAIARPFRTAAEAEAFNLQMATEAAKVANKT